MRVLSSPYSDTDADSITIANAKSYGTADAHPDAVTSGRYADSSAHTSVANRNLGWQRHEHCIHSQLERR
jgi:hypothetical protein